MKRKPKKEISIELIPIYIPEDEFREKKAEIQNLIARMIIAGWKCEAQGKQSLKMNASKFSKKTVKVP